MGNLIMQQVILSLSMNIYFQTHNNGIFYPDNQSEVSFAILDYTYSIGAMGHTYYGKGRG
jgi:hypothetical protein